MALRLNHSPTIQWTIINWKFGKATNEFIVQLQLSVSTCLVAVHIMKRLTFALRYGGTTMTLIPCCWLQFVKRLISHDIIRCDIQVQWKCIREKNEWKKKKGIMGISWLFIQGYVGECRDVRTIVTAQMGEGCEAVNRNKNKEQCICHVCTVYIWEKTTFVQYTCFNFPAWYLQMKKTAIWK